MSEQVCTHCRRFDCNGDHREPLARRIVRYLHKHVALSTAQMYAWAHSCTKGGGYSLGEFDQTLRDLRNEGRIACANGEWYLRWPEHQAQKQASLDAGRRD
jgi:hypothetical protein